MDLITGYTVALPILRATDGPNGAFVVQGEVMGTAFGIGGDFMMTARHVVEACLSYPGEHMVVAVQSPDRSLKSVVVREYELLDADVAILRVEYVVPGSDKWFHTFKWQTKGLQPFEVIRAVGYGYGMHVVEERRSVVVRGFQGHVVAGVEFKPTWVERPFQALELSFQVPRGLSGAPLLNSAGNVCIHGMVIGNSEARMTVFRSEERIEESGEKLSVEQYEALTLGMAVHPSAILDQRSKSLGGSVAEFLRAKSLLLE